MTKVFSLILNSMLSYKEEDTTRSSEEEPGFKSQLCYMLAVFCYLTWLHLFIC